MSILDIATTDVVTADEETSATKLAGMMEEHEVGTIVVTEDDEPDGVVTDRDIALAVTDNPDLAEVTARDVMSAEPLTVSTEAGVFEIVERMDEAGVRRLPVVEDDGALAGVVSLDDLLVLLGGELGDVSDLVQKQGTSL